jgi:hypothetical protein
MVDLETMSTRTNAAIASIGAVIFNPLDNTLDNCPTFYQVVCLESNDKDGRHFSGSTISWWLKQSEAARAALLTDSLPLHTSLMRLNVFIAQHRPLLVWANSPSFDCAILKGAYAHHHMTWPFDYWKERDLRTLKDIAYPNGDAPKCQRGVAHGALDDALAQAELVQRCHFALRTGS